MCWRLEQPPYVSWFVKAVTFCHAEQAVWLRHSIFGLYMICLMTVFAIFINLSLVPLISITLASSVTRTYQACSGLRTFEFAVLLAEDSYPVCPPAHSLTLFRSSTASLYHPWFLLPYFIFLLYLVDFVVLCLLFSFLFFSFHNTCIMRAGILSIFSLLCLLVPGTVLRS